MSEIHPILTFSGCVHKSHIPGHKFSELMSTNNLKGKKTSSVEGGLFVSLLEAYDTEPSYLC